MTRHLDARLVEAALALVSWWWKRVRGAAATLADQVLAGDPYAERAHRLAVAAWVRGPGTGRRRRPVDRLCRVLDDLGARPESTTQILLRNAAQWLRPAVTTPPGLG